MSKRTFGKIIRKRREELSLTQRDLAERLGVKGSHVAFLESGRRRPSLSLLKRVADTLRLDPQKLFVLTHPEAEFLARVGDRCHSGQADSAWQRFASNDALLAKEHVSPKELRLLKRVSLMSRVSSERQFLFVLKTIRLAVEDD